MKQLFVKGNNLIIEGNTPCKIEDLFTPDFFKISDSIADNYKNGTFAENELFIGIIQPVLALRKWILDNNIDKINIRKADAELYSYLVDIAKEEGLSIVGHKRLFLLQKIVIAHFQIIASSIYLLWLMIRIPYLKDKTVTQEFSVIRTVATGRKMHSINVDKEIENPKAINSIYRIFPIPKRLLWIIRSWGNSYWEIHKFSNLIKYYIGKNTTFKVYSFYGKRVVHMLLYYNMLDEYFSLRQGMTFYTGNNLDRFSVIEDQLAEKYGIFTVCIPHGLEYGFKFPKGFSGKIFYTTSKSAEEHLNNLYNTNKYIFDFNIARNIFKLNQQKMSLDTKVVFFTEPREVNVNQKIIDELLPLMIAENMKLSLKLHPKDHLTDYSKYQVEFINDMASALIANICFARKSTTLLEAVYNDSKVAAILTNPKDTSIFYTFPSLQSEQITVTTSVQELFNWISNEYKLISKS